MPRLTIEISKDDLRRLRERSDKRAGEGDEPLGDAAMAALCVPAALNRWDTLDRDAAKREQAKREKAAGVAQPSVTFKRYTPTVPDERFAANKSEREVVAWAAKAPARNKSKSA
jgi:hypothetical protein